ncbi:MAG: serine hydrolase [Proteobacteria bacterium]|nr:serine hydrolase [Pseudomonadota bacterium]MBU1687615.1 serine hydrolase [Pseudomonadota bacterium]
MNKIDELLEIGIKNKVFSAASAGVYYNGNKFIWNKLDDVYKNYFDLASLTKPLCTSLILVSLINDIQINLDDNLCDYFDTKIKCKIKNLLNHSSGFVSYRNYYNILYSNPIIFRKDKLLSYLLSEQQEYECGQNSCYSDLDFMLLGFLIEKVSGRNIQSYFEEKILGPLNLSDDIFFQPLDRPHHDINLCIPSENCPNRNKLIQGEVNDENCWIMGGIGGHAGLFGDISSVMTLAEAILSIWKGRIEHPSLPRPLLTHFLKRHDEKIGSGWAYGFDTPSKGKSSSGKYFSERSVGHLGFTGTSFWIDPEKDMIVVLLTNRTIYGRDNHKIKEFRPYFHDTLIEETIGKNFKG